MSLKVLFFGDIFGKPGREVLRRALPGLKKTFQPDLILANGENLAHGAGITPGTLEEILDAGVDVVTGGNHSFANFQGQTIFEDETLPIVRPMNFTAKKGRGFFIWERSGKKVLIANLIGRLFMKLEEDEAVNPFQSIDDFLSSKKDLPVVRILDFHAETTSEKTAMGYFLDGRVSAVVGTHTHVMTADGRVLPKGTGYITDIGMCGPGESVIGMQKEPVIKNYLGQNGGRAEPEEEGTRQINALFLEFDEISGKCLSLQPVNNVFA